jgi:hypothetical protein
MKLRLQNALSFFLTASGIFYFLELVSCLGLVIYDRVYQERPWEWEYFIPWTIFTLLFSLGAAGLLRHHHLEAAELLEEFGKSMHLYLGLSLIASAIVVGFLDPSYLKLAAYLVLALAIWIQCGRDLVQWLYDVRKAGLQINLLRIKWALQLLIVKDLPAGTLEFLETQEEAWESS